MTISEAEKIIIEEFAQYDGWIDKYSHLVQMGKMLPLIDEKFKTDQFRINGCQSQLWLYAALEDGKVMFYSDSDAIISRGMASLLIRVLSGQTPDDIIAAKMDFIGQIGLQEHLSLIRSNGLNAIVKQMKLYALVFKTKIQQEIK